MYTKTTWAERLRQYTNRLSLTPAAGGAAVQYDVEQVEGTVSQPGTAVSPTNMNQIEDALERALSYEMINVTNPGHGLTAMVGDNSDENTEWSAILAYAAAQKMDIYVPAGTFKVYGFSIPEDVKIFGKNKHESILQQIPDPATNYTSALVTNLFGTHVMVDDNSNGLADGYSNTSTATNSFASNTQTIKFSARYGKFYRDVVAPAGHIIYACVKVQTSSNLIMLMQNESPYNHTHATGKLAFEFLSLRFTNVGGTKGVSIQTDEASGWTDVKIKDFRFIDLTNDFGAGNEPSQLEMDKFITDNYSFTATKANATVYNTQDFVTIENDNTGMKNIFLNCNYWGNGGSSNGIVMDGAMNNTLLEDVEIWYADGSGLSINALSWIFDIKNITVKACNQWGIKNLGTDNKFAQITLINNMAGNIWCGGANNLYDQIKTITAGIGTQNEAPGMYINCSRSSFTNIDTQENAGHGILFGPVSIGNVMIGVIADANGADFNGAVTIKPLDGVLKGDGVRFGAGSTYNAVIGLNSGNKSVTASMQSQNRGYHIEATSNYNTVLTTLELYNNATSVDYGTGNILLHETDPMTAVGDMIYQAATGKPAALAKGTAYQHLGMKSDASIQEWQASLQSLLTAGGMIYGSAANTPSNLAKGTAYQSLNMKSDATIPEWQASLQSLLTAGGMIYGSAANTPADLAKGTALQLLGMKSDATIPEWKTFANSLGASGYQVMPGGLIIQWGTVTNVNGSTGTSVTFPLAFPSACCSVTLGSEFNSGSPAHMGIGGKATDHFHVYSSSNTEDCDWVAVGY